MERKLVALLMVDAVSSTSAMERNEEAAVAEISAHLTSVATAVENHSGRVFSKAGDSVLAEFTSPKNALLAALEARARLAADGDGAKMRFGLHVADVLVDGSDLLGDGVNLTARIQAAANPGDILVSDALFAQVRRASPCTFFPPTEEQFRGISEPVTVYRVKEKMDRHLYHTESSRKDVTAPRKPNSVAVVPFRTPASADDDQTFLAEGLTEDLILELTRVQDLFVVSRTAANELRDRDPVEIGRSAGVGFVLTGSVRKIANRVRLNISLYNGETGSVIWSDRVQRDFDELLDALDDVVVRVASTVFGRIEQAAIQAAKLKRPDSMTAYEHYLRGMELHRMGGVTLDHYREAVEWFDRAIAEDKGFSRGYSMKVCSGSNLTEFDFDDGKRDIETALRLNPEDAEAHRIMGNMQLLMHRDFEKARWHYERAMQLAPNNAYIVGRAAAYHIFDGDPVRGLDLLDRAEAMDPFVPVWILEDRIRAFYVLGQYEDLFACAKALPYQTRCSRIYRAVVRAKSGNPERAKQLIASTLADDPSLTSDYIMVQELYRDLAIRDEILHLAIEAGLPIGEEAIN